MAVQPILQLGDPRLRLKCEHVADCTAHEIYTLIEDLVDTLLHTRAECGYGRAIAAPQIGVLKRVVVVCLPGEEPLALINPKIIWRSDSRVTVWDACLSFLSIFMQVTRYESIRVRYQDAYGVTQVLDTRDQTDLSELLQHEIDHLDGILAIDRVSDYGTICTREEFERRFRPSTVYALR